MDAELRTLEEKIRHLAELCQRLRVENNQLRQQLASATNDNKHLSEKINVARARLENLMSHIPGGEINER
ncbi:MAG: hypothetical protein HYU77_03800 [Betaproteobacteria bacterium]|nr:hypothetical protein [Betaproteobacteria bacterium]